MKHAIGPYEDLLTTNKRRKLKWYGHVSRSSGDYDACTVVCVACDYVERECVARVAEMQV